MRQGLTQLSKLLTSNADDLGALMAAFPAGRYFAENLVTVDSVYSNAGWTETKSGTGAGLAQSTAEGGGALLTAPSDGSFNINMQSIFKFPFVTGRHFGFGAIIELSDIAGVGFSIGFGNSQAAPFGTEYTDFIGVRKAIAGATVLGKVRGNSDTAADTPAFATMANATRLYVGGWFIPDSSSDTGSVGEFIVHDGTTPGHIELTAAQKAQLHKYFTTPPSTYANINMTGTTGNNPTMNVVRAAFFSGNGFTSAPDLL